MYEVTRTVTYQTVMKRNGSGYDSYSDEDDETYSNLQLTPWSQNRQLGTFEPAFTKRGESGRYPHQVQVTQTRTQRSYVTAKELGDLAAGGQKALNSYPKFPALAPASGSSYGSRYAGSDSDDDCGAPRKYFTGLCTAVRKY